MKLLSTVFTALVTSFGTWTYMQNQELAKIDEPTKCTAPAAPAHTGVATDADAQGVDPSSASSERVLELEQEIESLKAQMESSQAIPTCEAKVEEELRDLGMDLYHWMCRCGTLFADMSSHLGKRVVAAVWPWPAPGFMSHSDVSNVASKAVDAVSNITCEGTLSSLFNDGLGMKLETKAACEAAGEHVEKAVSALPVDKLKSSVDYASDQAGRALSTPVEMARPLLATLVEDFVQGHPQHASTLQKDPVLIALVFAAFALVSLWLLYKEIKFVVRWGVYLLRLTLQVLCCPCRLCCRRRFTAMTPPGSKAAGGKAGRSSAVGGS